MLQIGLRVPTLWGLNVGNGTGPGGGNTLLAHPRSVVDSYTLEHSDLLAVGNPVCLWSTIVQHQVMQQITHRWLVGKKATYFLVI